VRPELVRFVSAAGDAVVMEITARFTNIYDDEEHVHEETFDVSVPTPADFGDELVDWSEDHLFPRTGDGNAVDKDAAYFVVILACQACPELVAREFAWGI